MMTAGDYFWENAPKSTLTTAQDTCWSKLSWATFFRNHGVGNHFNHFFKDVSEAFRTKYNQCFFCKERSLRYYLERKPHLMFPDLTQSAKNGRGRGEVQGSAMMTLTRNTHYVYSRKHGRFLQPREALSCQVLPVTKRQSKACGSPMLALPDGMVGSAFNFAGNGMNIPCVGCIMLAAMFGLSEIRKSDSWTN